MTFANPFPSVLVAGALLVGCAAPPWPAPERTAAEAAGGVAAIAFRAEGGALDEGAAIGERLSLADALRRALETHPDGSTS